MNSPSDGVEPSAKVPGLFTTTHWSVVLAALRREYTEAGNRRVFEELAELLWGKDASTSYALIGERLGMTEGTARGAMHRLRERYRERLRTEVAQTVAHADEVEEELRYLIKAVSQRD